MQEFCVDAIALRVTTTRSWCMEKPERDARRAGRGSSECKSAVEPFRTIPVGGEAVEARPGTVASAAPRGDNGAAGSTARAVLSTRDEPAGRTSHFVPAITDRKPHRSSIADVPSAQFLVTAHTRLATSSAYLAAQPEAVTKLRLCCAFEARSGRRSRGAQPGLPSAPGTPCGGAAIL